MGVKEVKKKNNSGGSGNEDSNDSYKVGKIKKFFNKLAALLKKGAVRVAVILVSVLVISLVFLLLTFMVINGKYVNKMDGVCVEANEFSSAAKIVRSKPENNDEIIQLLSTPKYEEFSQKMKPTDLNLTLNGEAIMINIMGKWTPWRMDDATFSEPNDNFICLLEKKLMPEGFTFSNRDEENEFYYIKNFYTDVFVKKDSDGDIIIRGVSDAPERQKNCWVTRGAGLYLGSYGINGKTQPTAYHHLIASKMICTTANWFGGDVKQEGSGDNYVITNYYVPTTSYGSSISLASMDGPLRTLYYDDDSAEFKKPESSLQFKTERYTLGDFKRAYFSLDGEHINDILTTDANQIIYNVEEHERLLYSSDRYKKDAARIIASAISVFNKACYSLEKDEHDNTIRKYNAYYQYGPEILYKNHPRFFNIKYDVGERIKMLIVDKYYSDNYGFYQIEILSGINFDDSGTIEARLKEVEFYFLGTPMPGTANDRTDGMVAKIYNNLLNTGFASLVRAALALYVLLYGYRIMFGFKKDKKVISMSALMVDLFKLSLIICLVSETGFQFFNRIVMNFVINGVVGFVDLIAGIFGTGLVGPDNFIALSGGLTHSGELASFSKNFKIIDEVLALLKTDTIVLKIFSLFYNTGWNFFLGIPVGTGVWAVILIYVFKLAMVVVPFMFTLLQLTLTLPLAPLFILFSFFDFTKEYFENWLKFVLGKALEIFAFFLGFYFVTFIINNKIKELLSFKVCFYKMGNYIFGDGDDLVFIVKWIRDGLNHALFMEKSGMPDNFFIFYLINISMCLILLALFDSISKSIMSIISGIFVVDGASAGGGGGNATLSDFTGKNEDGSSKFSMGSQLKEFAQTTGLATIQEEADALAITRPLINLNKSGMDNLKQTGKNLFDAAAIAPKAFIKTADEGIEHRQRKLDNPDNNEQLETFRERFRRNVNEGIGAELNKYTGEAFGEHSLIDLGARNFGNPYGPLKGYKNKEIERYTGKSKILRKFNEMAIRHSRNRRLDGLGETYYRKDIFDKNRDELITEEMEKGFLSDTEDKLRERLKELGADEKTTKRIIKLKKLLNGVRSKKVKFSVRGKNLEDVLIKDGTIEKINDYMKGEYKGEATDIFSEEAMNLIDEDASAIFDAGGTNILNENTTDVIDVRVHRIRKTERSAKNKDEEARKAMDEKIKKMEERLKEEKKEREKEEKEKKKKKK